MRKRSLSTDGRQLYLDSSEFRSRKWYQRLFYNLFSTDYDERLFDVVNKSRLSTRALCAHFCDPKLSLWLDAAIYNTINLIIQQKSDYNFFLDVMIASFKKYDHQTAHLMYLVLTNTALDKLNIKKPKRAAANLLRLANVYGAPSYEKHVHFWRSVRSDSVLPSVIAFHNFVRRRQFMKRFLDAQEAIDFMEIYKYLEYNKNDILPVYLD